jgi:rod shape-determining protein MreC
LQPSFVRAWYVFVGLSLLSFVFTAFVGTVPADVSSAVALPHDLIATSGRNLRTTVVSLGDRADLRADNAALRDALADSEASRRQLELRMQELEALLEVRRNQSPGAVLVASVVGRSRSPAIDTLTLGAGRRDGVVRGMPVSAPAGLVGIVVEVAETRSVVRTLLDPRSRVGVSVRDKGGQGVAVGDVGDLVRVDRFIAEREVNEGDVVETTSYGGLFPRGIAVGVVREVLPQDPNELRRSFLVQPAVDFGALKDVVLFTPQ